MMKLLRERERGFTLIELLIVVAILGILAAVVIPNVGRFLGRGEAEARRAEGHDINTAVTALMTENNMSAIPNPVALNTAPCTTGTQDMNAFPDTASVVATADKLNDPNGNAYVAGVLPARDKDGYVLFGHDITGNAEQLALVNYINFDNTTHCYTIDANGTVHQYNEAGVEQVD